MKTKGYGTSDLGKTRSNNEDRHFLDDEAGIYIVCDGMGGHQAGEIASQTAVETLSKKLKSERPQWSTWLLNEEAGPMKTFVKQCVQEAGEAIHSLAKSNPAAKGMGTTLSMILTAGEKAVLAHIGDSRVYLYREERAHQLSVDHTLLQDFIAHGLLTTEEAKDHPHGNVLTKALGVQAAISPDLLFFPIFTGDRFLLCSDGLSNTFESNDEVTSLLDEANDIEQLPQQLISLANDRGGKDNITAVVFEVIAEAAQADTEFDIGPIMGTPTHWMYQHLRKSFLGRSIPLREALRLLPICNIATFSPEQQIQQAGSLDHCFSLILEGLCASSSETAGDAVLNEGDTFGEVSLLKLTHADANIKALTQVTLLQIKHEDFMAFVRNRPQIGWKLMRNIAREMLDVLEKIKEGLRSRN